MRHEELPPAIGKYRPLSHLAAGGMGRVFLALDPQGRTVALKQLHPAIADDRKMRERLRREVAVMQRLRSPRIAELVDADLDADPPYIVTRYVQGRTLREVVQTDGPLRGEALLRTARGIAEALVAVHGAGHVHRDLKPSNVMMVDSDPVLIDFGIAQEQDATRLTRDGGVTGSVGYMAPEVLEGGPVGPAADVFAWGATVAYAATGRPVFGDGGMQAVALRTLQGAADLAGVPAEIRPLVTAALAVPAAARPDARTLLGALSSPDALASFSAAHPAVRAVGTATHPAPSQATDRRTLWTIVAGVAAALALTVPAVLITGYVKNRGSGGPAAPVTATVIQSGFPRPTYTGQIANWAEGKKFADFLAGNVGRKVYIRSPLDESITLLDGLGKPYGSSGESSGDDTAAFFVFWTDCPEKLAPGEEPTNEKCTGYQVLIRKDRLNRAGVDWVRGAYWLTGNFEVTGGVMHQGIVGFALVPTEAA
ncbi:serine/threonine-protein kinase [uncultured Thermomonospora sp.]|uniref:serine/threonine-protein kinase n=1 Tax=uncultured Thermomonospora sp. TaxID=671175 RepID=UPI00259BA7F8|nr:serine/threonine-protein kinase [uncultured Thermomonospora sp.]